MNPFLLLAGIGLIIAGILVGTDKKADNGPNGDVPEKPGSAERPGGGDNPTVIRDASAAPDSDPAKPGLGLDAADDS